MAEQNMSWFKLNPNYTYLIVWSFCVLLWAIADMYDNTIIYVISCVIMIFNGIQILDIKNRSLWWIFTNGFLIPVLLKNRGEYTRSEETSIPTVLMP